MNIDGQHLGSDTMPFKPCMSAILYPWCVVAAELDQSNFHLQKNTNKMSPGVKEYSNDNIFNVALGPITILTLILHFWLPLHCKNVGFCNAKHVADIPYYI